MAGCMEAIEVQREKVLKYKITAGLHFLLSSKYNPVSNAPFLSKMTEQMLTTQLQGSLNEADCLDSFQSCFRPGYGVEWPWLPSWMTCTETQTGENNPLNSPGLFGGF